MQIHKEQARACWLDSTACLLQPSEAPATQGAVVYRWKTSGYWQVCKYQSTYKRMAETGEGSVHGSELCPA